MAKGKIKRLFEDKGYGFIQPDESGEDIWFHTTKLEGKLTFTQLKVGLEVEFEAEQGRRGGQQAKFVRVIVSEEEAQALAQAATSYRFLNPYNFVRFLSLSEPQEGKQKTQKMNQPESVMTAAFAKIGMQSNRPEVRTEERRLLGRCIPPPHDRYVGLTGKIICELENVTPLFVSDPDYKLSGEHKVFEFFKLDGKRALPAASLRGMVRSVFEAVTNSCLMFLTGQRLSYREINEAKKLWPARVTKEKEEGKWWLHILAGTTSFTTEGVAPGQRLPAAWVMQYSYDKLQKSPTVNYGENSGTPYGKRTAVILPPQGKHKSGCWALLEPMSRPSRKNKQGKLIEGFDFWNVKQLAEKEDDLKPEGKEKVKHGWLCITCHNIENKHDERFFFTESSVDPIEIEEKVVNDYKELIQDYQSRHRDDVRKREKRGFDPAQPLITKDKKGKEKKEAGFSRFILEDHAELRDGDIVYALLEEVDKKPIVKVIVPVSVPRVNYHNSIAKMLKSKHEHLLACDKETSLCPACRIFGWVHQGNKNKSEQVAYAGRLKFSNGELKDDKGTLPSTPLAILSSPKPTTTPFYLLPESDLKNNKWAGKGGYDGNNKLRGRKLYRHHGECQVDEYKRKGESDDQNRTVKDALKEGAKFEFTIQFENLAPIELGALLWALEIKLKDGTQLHHRLGFAKPLGFGSVKMNVSKLEVLNLKDRYSALDKSGWQTKTDWQDCVNSFKAALVALYDDTKDFESLDNVKDMKALLGEQTHGLPVHYPRSTKEPRADGKNYEWFMGNKKSSNNYALPLACHDDEGLPLIDQYGNQSK